MRILTDAASDLTPQDIEKWGIEVVPLYIQFPNEEVSSSDISPDDFYNRLKAMVPQVPTTSQPAVGVFLERYQKPGTEPIVSVHLSAGLSGTHNSASLAAKQTTDRSVTVIDTMTLSCGQRYQVLAAAAMAKAGATPQQITERLSQIAKQTEVIYTLETLEYLARGGRIGRVQSLMGSLLSIKPVIHVADDGKYSTIGRGRTVTQAIGQITEHLVKRYGSTDPVWVTIVHGQLADKAAALEELLRAGLKVARFDLVRTSPVLGVHTGPGLVGAGVVPMSAFAGIDI